MKKVVFFSTSHDPHSTKLESELTLNHDCKVIRFDVDKLSSSIWCNIRIGDNKLETNVPASLKDAHSVYYRRLSVVRSHKMWRHIPQKVREFSVWEAESALFGICGYLHDVPWVNHYKSIDIASNKPYQLMVAKEAGLNIPDTLVTNSPEEVKEFFFRHYKKIIYKPVSYSIVFGNENETGFVYTSRVAESHLQSVDKIKVVPGIFQEEVQKEYELRITVVDDVFFVAKVETSEPCLIDWRKSLGKGTKFSKHWISSGLKNKILKFMSKIGIRYGAFDFIVKPDGTAVFLEVNPQGAYLWLEEELGFRITSTMANALARDK